MLDVLIHLVGLGEVAPVLRVVSGWAATEDHSLTRHFITQVLGHAAPPYSDVFCRGFLEVLETSGLIESIRSTELARKVVAGFVSHLLKRDPPVVVPKVVVDILNDE